MSGYLEETFFDNSGLKFKALVQRDQIGQLFKAFGNN